MAAGFPDFVKAIYPYNGADQAVPLPFTDSAILLVAERTDSGWCRGFATGKEGWFPASYVKALSNETIMQNGVHPESLAAVMRSPEWTVYSTGEDKIYYVNTQTQGTTWELPVMPAPSPPSPVPPISSPISEGPLPSAAALINGQIEPQIKQSEKSKSWKRKPKYRIVNGLTFLEHDPDQKPLNPTERSYVDHFWADKGDQSGFDILLEKHLHGKFAMKDMMEFFRERAAIEEHYAKSLLKLSRSTLGDQEEGSVGRAWQSLKAELRYRSEAHSKFASQLLKEMEKPVFEFKESQKKKRKEHQQIMEKSRKQVQALDASIEKTRAFFTTGRPKLTRKASMDVPLPISSGRRKGSHGATLGDDLKKLEESYNQAQRLWMDNMINACRDYESQEEEKSDFLKDHFLKYVDICVEVDEASADSLSKVTDAIDRINKKNDREFFIKTRGTGTLRPVNRVVEL